MAVPDPAAISHLICSKTGVKAIGAAFDQAVTAAPFSSPQDALQQLFAWGACRNHETLLMKLHSLRSTLPNPPRVAVDPIIRSSRGVWDILLPEALGRRSQSQA